MHLTNLALKVVCQSQKYNVQWSANYETNNTRILVSYISSVSLLEVFNNTTIDYCVLLMNAIEYHINIDIIIDIIIQPIKYLTENKLATKYQQ